MAVSYLPNSYSEALKLLNEKEMTIIAGGTDLMVKRRNWSNLPAKFDKEVLFVAGLEELKYIIKKEGKIHIGAGTTLQELLVSKDIPDLLSEAMSKMASFAIRHTGTLGGNIVNASPAGDSIPVLYILNAVIVVESTDGRRNIPIEEFITAPGRTVLKKNEILKEIIIENKEFNRETYKKVGGRKSDAISKICFCGAADIDESGIIKDIRLAIGAVAPTIVRRVEIEKSLVGKKVNEVIESIDEILGKYSEFVTPIDDQRSTAKYRKTVSLRIIKDFLMKLK